MKEKNLHLKEFFLKESEKLGIRKWRLKNVSLRQSEKVTWSIFYCFSIEMLILYVRNFQVRVKISSKDVQIQS